MRKKSIIPGVDDNRCFICGASRSESVPLEKHHCLHGTALRKLADRYRLWVYLCHECHVNLHDHGAGDFELECRAQRAYEMKYQCSHDEFREVFGKSWL